MHRAIFIEKNKCIGCSSCIVACKLEHNLPPHPIHPPLGNPKGPALIRVHQVGPQIPDDEVHQYFQPIFCVHCSDSPCIEACPHSAIDRDIEMGITLVHEDQCMGCRSCLEVCPYGAPQFYDDKLKLCDLCIHRLAVGKCTACEATCPARVIHVGTANEISGMAAKRVAERADKET